MYTFGEQTVVVPVKGIKTESVARGLAKNIIKEKIRKELPKGTPIVVNMPTENTVELLVPGENIAEIIGKKGANIEKLEQRVGAKIQVRELTKEQKTSEAKELNYDIHLGKRSVEIYLDPSLSGKSVDINIGGEYLFTATASKKGKIRIINKSEVGKRLINAKNSGEEIKILL
jgi:ATPase